MRRLVSALAVMVLIGTALAAPELCAQQAPASSLFITNLTRESIPVRLVPGTRYPAGYVFANGVREFDCRDTTEIVINTGGQVITWNVECGRRYAIRVDSSGQAYELVEVTSK
jgi:hypothetical protein